MDSLRILASVMVKLLVGQPMVEYLNWPDRVGYNFDEYEGLPLAYVGLKLGPALHPLGHLSRLSSDMRIILTFAIFLRMRCLSLQICRNLGSSNIGRLSALQDIETRMTTGVLGGWSAAQLTLQMQVSCV